MVLDAEHDAFIDPLHGLYLVCLSSSAKADDPVNTESRLLDAPPELVIGPATLGRTRWRGMTSHSFGNSNPISRSRAGSSPHPARTVSWRNECTGCSIAAAISARAAAPIALIAWPA